MKAAVWLLASWTLSIAVAAPAFAATFRGLGDLPGGSYMSGASGISADGCVVVGMSASAQGEEAFRWDRRGGMVSLGDLAGGPVSGSAWAASADGSVIVGTSVSSNGQEAFRWTSATGMVALGSFPAGTVRSVANSVSADGRVIVGYSMRPSGWEAFRWTQATGVVGLGDLAGGEFFSAADGISADGTVIVGFGTSDAGQQTIRWTSEGGMVGLGDLPGGAFQGGANGVSPDGLVIVGNDYSELPSSQAFLWYGPEGMNGLGYLTNPDVTPWSEALDISAVGYRVVGFAGPPGPASVATVWDPMNGMRRVEDILNAEGVDLAGWKLSEANAISDNGRIVVGRGVNPQGRPEAWLAVLPGTSPDPSIPGDANLDGAVDQRDLAIVASHLGATCGATFEQGDFDGDGAISMIDLLIVKRQFGAPAAGHAAAVPEPGTVWLAIAGGMAGGAIWWRLCRRARSRGRRALPGEREAIRGQVR